MNHFKIITAVKFPRYLKWEYFTNFDWKKLKDFLEGFFWQRYKKVEGEGVNLRDIMCCKIIKRTVSHDEMYHKKIQMQRTEQIKMVGEKIAC